MVKPIPASPVLALWARNFVFVTIAVMAAVQLVAFLERSYLENNSTQTGFDAAASGADNQPKFSAAKSERVDE